MALVVVSKIGDSIRIGDVEVKLGKLTYRRAELTIEAPAGVRITRVRGEPAETAGDAMPASDREPAL